MKVQTIATLGIDEKGQYHLKVNKVPLHIVKKGMLQGLEGVLESEIRAKLESKIVQPNGKKYIKSGLGGEIGKN